MTQRDRDRLVVLKHAQKRQITQQQAGEQLGCTERHVRRLLKKLKGEGDKAIFHGLRGRPSNRRRNAKEREAIVRILSQEVYRGFGPTLAAEYLAQKHKIEVGREALRQIMLAAQLWRGSKRRVETVHQWRERKHSRGEMVQWDTSEHDWLEARSAEKLYLIHMIDDATSELTARFVGSDSNQENLRMPESYLQKHGRPVAFYTDKASLFQTAPKTPRDQKELPRQEREPLPPTQIGRALRELGIAWLTAHSPQAKGRVERSFQTAQDRLVKGLRVAGAKSLAEANRYLQAEFLPWWNQHLQVVPANPIDAHRPLGPQHDLAASLSVVKTRQVANDYTIRFEAQVYQIARPDIRPGLRGASVYIESRLDGTLQVRFQQHYLAVSLCPLPPPRKLPATALHKPRPARAASSARKQEHHDFLAAPAPFPLWQAAHIDRTRTTDTLEE